MTEKKSFMRLAPGLGERYDGCGGSRPHSGFGISSSGINNFDIEQNGTVRDQLEIKIRSLKSICFGQVIFV